MILPPEQLMDLLSSYAKDSKLLKEQVIEICSFMNGGIELSSAWEMSFEDREVAIKIINKRLKERNPDSKEYM